MEPVKSLARFEELKSNGKGFFIITDSANPTKIHDVTCSFVTAENFQTKVIDNKGKNGHYSWISHWDGIVHSDEISPCKKCIG